MCVCVCVCVREREREREREFACSVHNVLRRLLELNRSSNEIGEICRSNLTLILLVR